MVVTALRGWDEYESKVGPDGITYYWYGSAWRSREAIERKRRADVAYKSKKKKNTYHRLKTEVYDILGRECVRCGFNDPRALQIDHAMGMGHQERTKAANPLEYLRGVLAQANTGKYQILCANCNQIKRHEDGEWFYERTHKN